MVCGDPQEKSVKMHLHDVDAPDANLSKLVETH